jgi:hypothetical protein
MAAAVTRSARATDSGQQRRHVARKPAVTKEEDKELTITVRS